MPSSHAYGFHPRQVDARRADPPGSGAGRRRRRGRGLHSHRRVGLHRGRTGARARGPGQGCDPSPDQARRHRAHADDGRVPAVLGPRPGGDVRPGTGRQDLVSDLLPVALRAARAGAAVLLESGLAHPGIAAELKGRGDYVTATDRRSESAILEVLAREAPGIAVLAEERGGARASTMWAVDPLDGTTNFTRGFPSVGVSVALLDAGRPVVGVVLAPFLRLEFTAARGGGASLNGERLPPHRELEPARAVVATGFPFRNKGLLPRYLAMFNHALARFEDLRRGGARPRVDGVGDVRRVLRAWPRYVGRGRRRRHGGRGRGACDRLVRRRRLDRHWRHSRRGARRARSAARARRADDAGVAGPTPDTVGGHRRLPAASRPCANALVSCDMIRPRS